MLPFFYFQSSCAHFNDTFLASVKVKRYLDPIKGALIVGSLKVFPSFCDKYKFCDTTWGVGWSDMIRFEDIDHLNTSNCSPFYNILWAPLWVAHSFCQILVKVQQLMKLYGLNCVMKFRFNVKRLHLFKTQGTYRVCHGFRLMKQDNYFWVNFDYF